MKTIPNNFIPFGKYAAINLFGVMFVRKGVRITDRLINHESIHTAQMKEMLYLGFYLWYGIEWFVKLIKYRNGYKAYRNISFEREAYDNEGNINYLDGRKRFS